MAEDFKLELEHESTFKKKNPSLSQAELEAKYTDLWIKHKATAKGSDRSKWESFQKKNGVLLSADTSPTKWGDGKPLFKVRFTKSNQITTSVSSSAQVRAWRTKFLTEGSPGTKLALKDTGKQFYDSKTGHALQIHHEKGISEYGPFIDESIKKLIPGNNAKTLKTGLKEYKTFKKWAFQTGRIFGDKTENYTALLRNQHINIPGSVHWLRSPEGPFYSVKATGGPAFDSPNPSLTPLAQRTQKQKLTAQTGVSATPTQDLLNKANRTTFTKNYDITKPGSIWDQMGEWDDLTSKSTKDAVALARQIANPTNEPNKIPKVDEARVKSTNLKDQIPVIKKIAAQYQLNEGLNQIDAINKAKIEYNRIRYGDTLAKGFDIRKLGLLSGSVYTTLKGLPGQAANIAKGLVGPEDLVGEEVLGNVGDFESKVKSGTPWQQAAVEEGKDIAGELKNQALIGGGIVLGAKITGTGTALGTVFNPITVTPLLAYEAYRGIDAYLERSGKKGLTRRYANFLNMYETKDPETGLGTGEYEKDPELEKEKWDKMRTYFENRNKSN